MSALAPQAKALAAKIEKVQESRAAAAARAAAASAGKAKKKAKKSYPYVEIPSDKMNLLDGYLGAECDSPEPAIKLLRQLLRENPNYGQAVMFLGSCYAIQGNTELASHYYREFLNKWPKHPDAEMVRSSLR